MPIILHSTIVSAAGWNIFLTVFACVYLQRPVGAPASRRALEK
jgi:hypothetical protein